MNKKFEPMKNADKKHSREEGESRDRTRSVEMKKRSRKHAKDKRDVT